MVCMVSLTGAATRSQTAALKRSHVPGTKKLVIVEQGAQYAAQSPVPAWLEANFDTLSGRILHLPRRADVNLPINEQLIVELYSK